MRAPPFAFLLLQACSSGIAGEVRDAQTGRPVADASVEVFTRGWGRIEGQLVWDKEYRHAARSGPDGGFLVSGIDGGIRFAVDAKPYGRLETNLCSDSPMIVRVGGPFEGKDLNRQLRTGKAGDGNLQGWNFVRSVVASPEDADLVLMSRPVELSNGGEPVARLYSRGGMAFVPGTGNPPAPPSSGYVTEHSLDLLKCGWLFVRFDGGLAAVRIGSFSVEMPVEGGHLLGLSYGVLGRS